VFKEKTKKKLKLYIKTSGGLLKLYIDMTTWIVFSEVMTCRNDTRFDSGGTWLRSMPLSF
jgi:hypothetical protein